jgi:anti-sigma regulatory factor (Ser/Thr protein kinase)
MMTGVVERLLPVQPHAVREARVALDEFEGDVPAPVLENARLLVSELVTNSIRHGGLSPEQRILLRASRQDAVLRVEVTDPGGGFELSPRTVSSADDAGWGLFLVGRIADRWGMSTDGKTSVWFEIQLDAPRP